MTKTFLFTIAVLAITSGSAFAADLYRITWRGTAYSNAPNGEIVARRLTENDYVNIAAQNNGLDPRTLVLVYRVGTRDIAVVEAATGRFIADAIQLEYVYTEVSNPSQTMTARQSFVFDAYHDQALGSAFGMERQKRDANGELTSFSFKGTFNYAYPDTGVVYSGNFATGKRVRDLSTQ